MFRGFIAASLKHEGSVNVSWLEAQGSPHGQYMVRIRTYLGHANF